MPVSPSQQLAVTQTDSRRFFHMSRPVDVFQQMFRSPYYYFHHEAFLPSFALVLLYLTVMSLPDQMITYLLASGLNSFHIALIRTLSILFKLSATWAAPRFVRRCLNESAVRGGLWSLGWQMGWLGAGVSFFWAEHQRKPLIAASSLVAATILSRLGLWGYDLCAQLIIQEAVDGANRGRFSSTEAGLQNGFELLSYVTTSVWSRPQQFRHPIVISCAAVYIANLLHGVFARKSRGYMVHLSCSNGAKW